MSTFQNLLSKLVILVFVGLVGLVCVSRLTAEQLVQSFELNSYKRVLDGQWEGIRYASDGNVYFGSSTHSAHHGASFFKYDPLSNQVTLLAEDITTICGEDPQTNPQGKLHSDIVEANGWLYMSTHFASGLPGAYDNWTGSHVIGYQLATGTFRDYGVVHPNYTSYSAIGVDPTRNYLYVFVTGQLANQVSYIYRIDTVTGAKSNLGQVGGSFNSCYWMFVDRRGDVWFSIKNQNGDLRRVRADTGQIDVFPNALPPLYRWDSDQVVTDASKQQRRYIRWIQSLDGDRALFTLWDYGGMLYMFDASKPIGSGQEFQNIKHIGYSDLGMAVGGNRVFYYQRANRGFGHQDAQDFHLLSVSLDPASGYPITDHGLIKDQNGRLVWRIPGMMTDGQNRVFMIGDWWTIPGDLGTLRYNYNDGNEIYEQLPRGEFFAVANVAIDSSETIQFNATSYSVVENGGTATITVTRTGTGVVSVDYETSNNTAAAGSDYTTASARLNFSAGEVSKAFTVAIQNDSSAEGNESLNLTLSSPVGAALGQNRRAVLTITDDEAPDTLQFSTFNYTANETSASKTITVSRTGDTAATVSVNWTAASNTAILGTDFTAPGGTLTFAPGVTSQSFAVNIINDSTAEGNESGHLILSNPTGGTALGTRNRAMLTIADNDVPSSGFIFYAAAYNIGESGSKAIKITRPSGTVAQSVTLSTNDNGTAAAGVDYTAIATVLSFAVGETSKTVNLSVLTDTAAEGIESVNLTLTNPTNGGVLGAQRTSVLVINDNDTNGVLQFKLAAFSIGESGSKATITVTRTGGSYGAIGVSYATSDNTAAKGSDYTATAGTLSFIQGQTSKSFTVSILNDSAAEGAESLNLTLSNPTGGATLGHGRRAVLIITDND